jgi:uncharacterized paraquat-inducible protein A
MDSVTKAGISGIIIALIIIIFSPVYTYFLPYLVVTIVVLYVFGLTETKDGLLVAFTIYIFSEWILGSIDLVGFYLSKEPISFTVDLSMMMGQLLTTLFIILGGLIGAVLAKTRQRTKTTFQPIPVPLPPPSSPVSGAILEKIFCRYCGAENATDAVFCEKCGKKIG